MPALNYQKQFADAVQNGTKLNTIRKESKRVIKRGDKLYHYTGMRTKQCRLLRRSTCIFTFKLSMDEEAYGASFEFSDPYEALRFSDWIHGKWTYGAFCDFIAREDGFEDYDAMKDYIRKTYGFPFAGRFIRWKNNN